MRVAGNRVIEGFRVLAGTTDPTTAAPGTIRGDFGRDWGLKVQQNLVHGSDSVESAERELASVWFVEQPLRPEPGACRSTTVAASKAVLQVDQHAGDRVHLRLREHDDDRVADDRDQRDPRTTRRRPPARADAGIFPRGGCAGSRPRTSGS